MQRREKNIRSQEKAKKKNCLHNINENPFEYIVNVLGMAYIIYLVIFRSISFIQAVFFSVVHLRVIINYLKCCQWSPASSSNQPNISFVFVFVPGFFLLLFCFPNFLFFLYCYYSERRSCWCIFVCEYVARPCVCIRKMLVQSGNLMWYDRQT